MQRCWDGTAKKGNVERTPLCLIWMKKLSSNRTSNYKDILLLNIACLMKANQLLMQSRSED